MRRPAALPEGKVFIAITGTFQFRDIYLSASYRLFAYWHFVAELAVIIAAGWNELFRSAAKGMHGTHLRVSHPLCRSRAEYGNHGLNAMLKDVPFLTAIPAAVVGTATRHAASILERQRMRHCIL